MLNAQSQRMQAKEFFTALELETPAQTPLNSTAADMSETQTHPVIQSSAVCFHHETFSIQA